jgi:hypothetical protein
MSQSENPEAVAYQKAQETATKGAVPETGELLDAIEGVIKRFVILSDEQRDALALWVLHAFAIDAADTTPYLAITSPEKRSGKSRLLEVLAQLVPRAMEAANISDAALFRALGGDSQPVTLLFDEIDAVFGPKQAQNKEELPGLINAGYRRGAVAWRCVGEGSKQEVSPFPVFGPKALAGIGDLPDTIADRSIPIRLRRKSRDEAVERGRFKTIKAATAPIAVAATRWAEVTTDVLREAEPSLPDELGDRAQDGAEPLFAIADLAGEKWAARSRESLIALHREREDEGASWGIQLLADTRELFGDAIELATVDLVEKLKLDNEGPWKGWGRSGDGLTPRSLAVLLKPFGIHSKPVRDGTQVFKGYKREQFEDAWGRYLSLDPSPSGYNGYKPPAEPKNGGSASVTKALLLPIENGRKPLARAVVTDVTDQHRNGGDGAVSATPEEEAELERLASEFGGDR